MIFEESLGQRRARQKQEQQSKYGPTIWILQCFLGDRLVMNIQFSDSESDQLWLESYRNEARMHQHPEWRVEIRHYKLVEEALEVIVPLSPATLEENLGDNISEG